MRINNRDNPLYRILLNATFKVNEMTYLPIHSHIDEINIYIPNTKMSRNIIVCSCQSVSVSHPHVSCDFLIVHIYLFLKKGHIFKYINKWRDHQEIMEKFV